MKKSLLESGNCTTVDPDIFHAPKGEWRLTVLARKVCANCVLIDDCLEMALADPSLHGVLGGTTDRERQEMRRVA